MSPNLISHLKKTCLYGEIHSCMFERLTRTYFDINDKSMPCDHQSRTFMEEMCSEFLHKCIGCSASFQHTSLKRGKVEMPIKK